MIEELIVKMIHEATKGLRGEIEDLKTQIAKMRKADTDRLLSVSEAAKKLNLKEASLRKALRENRIEGVKVGRKYMISAQTIQNRHDQRTI